MGKKKKEGRKNPPSKSPLYSKGILPGALLALIVGLILLLSGPGYRMGWWGLGTGFDMLRWSFYGGIAAGVLSLAGMIFSKAEKRRATILLGLAGVIVGVICIYIPWSWDQKVKSVPGLHDITTDTENPPKFIAVVPYRKGARNPVEHQGSRVIARQKKGYPDLGPLFIEKSPRVAFDLALELAQDLGWSIVKSDSQKRRIEATDTTTWFGFKDDVVIRVTPTQKGSRIDLRSLSRIGGSDVGKNAERVEHFLKKLKETAG